MKRALLLALAAAAAFVSGCSSAEPATGLNGSLLVIGGGLDDDNRPVYERFIQLASRPGPPRIVIATAASGDQPANAQGKTESIRAYAPDVQIGVITRETPQAETVALIDNATAMFFTGGDQKRITDRYRPGGHDTPEAAAMRRLLARGGVIAGTSAGDAMMSDPMFLTGRSVEALGIPSASTGKTDDDDPLTPDRPRPVGPQIGPGLGFLPWAITDSHFFERNRVGRLIAAQEVAGKRLGIGVGEDACVEVDLATGTLTGISVADSLLVDAGSLTRDGLTRTQIIARVIRQGDTTSLTRLLSTPPAAPLPPPANAAVTGVPVVEPGQNRQLASWRFFCRASQPGSGITVLPLDNWQLIGWPDGRGNAVFSAGPMQKP